MLSNGNIHTTLDQKFLELCKAGTFNEHQGACASFLPFFDEKLLLDRPHNFQSIVVDAIIFGLIYVASNGEGNNVNNGRAITVENFFLIYVDCIVLISK